MPKCITLAAFAVTETETCQESLVCLIKQHEEGVLRSESSEGNFQWRATRHDWGGDDCPKQNDQTR
ncbi:MAG: hypothetical protein MJE68_26890 [Proteobacteria bacterium]|nr:hypothetical protein [Pseudomonadota bacterium]